MALTSDVRTKSSVARAVVPLLLGDVTVFDPAGCVGSAVTSLASRKGFLETGRAATGASTGLVVSEPTLFRKGLFEAKGEETRPVNISVAVGKGAN